MFCYKNQRFSASSVTFQIPDGYYIDTEPGVEADNHIRLWDPSEDYSIDIRIPTNSAGSKAELLTVLGELKPLLLKPISMVLINDMAGYHATYGQNQTQYYELWLDIDIDASLCIVITTTKSILKIDSAAVIAAIDPRIIGGNDVRD